MALFNTISLHYASDPKKEVESVVGIEKMALRPTSSARRQEQGNLSQPIIFSSYGVVYKQRKAVKKKQRLKLPSTGQTISNLLVSSVVFLD